MCAFLCNALTVLAKNSERETRDLKESENIHIYIFVCIINYIYTCIYIYINMFHIRED